MCKGWILNIGNKNSWSLDTTYWCGSFFYALPRILCSQDYPEADNCFVLYLLWKQTPFVLLQSYANTKFNPKNQFLVFHIYWYKTIICQTLWAIHHQRVVRRFSDVSYKIPLESCSMIPWCELQNFKPSVFVTNLASIWQHKAREHRMIYHVKFLCRELMPCQIRIQILEFAFGFYFYFCLSWSL